jgi:hypothetical protein
VIGDGDFSGRHQRGGCVSDLTFEHTHWILRLEMPAQAHKQHGQGISQTDEAHKVSLV